MSEQVTDPTPPADVTILPCPFCGGGAECFYVTGEDQHFWCGCRVCRIYVRQFAKERSKDTDAETAAIERWNRRARAEATPRATTSDLENMVARAIYERRLWRLGLVKDGIAFARQPAWEELPDEGQQRWLQIARTAIEAMQPIIAAARAEGESAERERCAKIAERHPFKDDASVDCADAQGCCEYIAGEIRSGPTRKGE